MADREDAIPAARKVSSQKDAIPAARMAAGQEDVILATRMAAGQEDVIPAAPMAADQEDAIRVAPTVAARKIAGPADVLLSVASRLDVPLRRVGSTGGRRRPSTGLARAVFPLHAPDHQHPAVVERVDHRRQALEDADPKTEAPTGVGLTVLARRVEGQADEPQDRVVPSGRWEPADRASARWDRHQVVRSRPRVDPVVAWPRSAAAFHLAEP